MSFPVYQLSVNNEGFIKKKYHTKMVFVKNQQASL